jgi:hypothetical protein
MKRNIICIIVVVALFSTASLSQPATARPPTVVVAAGSSYATAIRVPATNERSGIRYEHAYIASHYRGARMLGQRLGNHAGHIYDLMTFVAADGKQQMLYFDITSYFGHF